MSYSEELNYRKKENHQQDKQQALRNPSPGCLFSHATGSQQVKSPHPGEDPGKHEQKVGQGKKKPSRWECKQAHDPGDSGRNEEKDPKETVEHDEVPFN
jgi:hypothetical protein